ncbi:Uncharacterised protein [Mycobacteroides abscessus subsp. abscessus]|nr:Uncharacterised protein [Mycobacteroides abscessus subsp. abscessus]
MPTGSPTLPTNPVRVKPGWLGTPTSGGPSSCKVRIELRTTGWLCGSSGVATS